MSYSNAQYIIYPRHHIVPCSPVNTMAELCYFLHRVTIDYGISYQGNIHGIVLMGTISWNTYYMHMMEKYENDVGNLEEEGYIEPPNLDRIKEFQIQRIDHKTHLSVLVDNKARHMR